MGGGLLPNFMTEFRSVVNLRARRTDNLVVAESEKCKGGLSTSCSMFHNVILILYVYKIS